MDCDIGLGSGYWYCDVICDGQGLGALDLRVGYLDIMDPLVLTIQNGR